MPKPAHHHSQPAAPTAEAQAAVIAKAGSPAPRKQSKTSRAKVTIPMIGGAGKKAKDASAKNAGGNPSLSALKSAKPSRSNSSGKMSGLDAAVKVLTDAGKPMSTQDMVIAMVSKNLWKTSGKTPHATIYSAIIREIADKGSSSRFRKAQRGQFALAAPRGKIAR